jgi:pimeloyl-ACP methyl ester carboxylesterase
VLLFVSLLALLHLASFLFLLHDRNMRAYASRTLTDTFGHRIHYYQLEAAHALWQIVFIHGTPASAAVFGEQFKHPFPQANLVALDRPGFGLSTPGRPKPNLDDQANALEALLSKTAPRNIILVGHSYGAPIALLAALKFTNQVAGVVLVGGSVDPAQERTYVIQRIADWPVFSWVVPRPLRQCNRELLTLRKDLEVLQPRLKALGVPVVMVHGGRDRQVPIENVNYLKRQLANAGKGNLFSQIVKPGFNHFIPWEHPETVSAALSLLTNRITTGSQTP